MKAPAALLAALAIAAATAFADNLDRAHAALIQERAEKARIAAEERMHRERIAATLPQTASLDLAWAWNQIQLVRRELPDVSVRLNGDPESTDPAVARISAALAALEREISRLASQP
jgi:hypothetical protein